VGSSPTALTKKLNGLVDASLQKRSIARAPRVQIGDLRFPAKHA